MQRVLMRAKSTLAPPDVASLRELGRLQSSSPLAHPQLFGRMRMFYKNVPKGNAPVQAPTSLMGKYYANFVNADSLWPMLHVIMLGVPLGYTLQYFVGGHYHPSREFH